MVTTLTMRRYLWSTFLNFEVYNVARFALQLNFLHSVQELLHAVASVWLCQSVISFQSSKSSDIDFTIPTLVAL